MSPLAPPRLTACAAPAAYQQIPLVAHLGTSAERLYWYQDGVLIATAAPDTKLFLPPQAGTHRLVVVVDNAGRSDSITYRVE